MFDLFDFETPPERPTAGEQARLRGQWDGFMQRPDASAALLSFGLSLLSPGAAAGNTGATIAQAIGAAGESARATRTMDLKERDTEADIALTEARTDRVKNPVFAPRGRGRPASKGVSATSLFAARRADERDFATFVQKQATARRKQGEDAKIMDPKSPMARYADMDEASIADELLNDPKIRDTYRRLRPGTGGSLSNEDDDDAERTTPAAPTATPAAAAPADLTQLRIQQARQAIAAGKPEAEVRRVLKQLIGTDRGL